jgi:hypothetical protein
VILYVSADEIDDEPECPHCGRCVLCGPPCCEGMAKDIEADRLRRIGQHPDQIAARRSAKRARKLARRAAKREGK